MAVKTKVTKRQSSKVAKRVEMVPEMVLPATPQKSLMEKAAPLMLGAIVIMAFMLGLMWNKLQTPSGPMKFSDKMVAYAKELKLDTGKFKKCVAAGKKTVVDADTAQGAQSGVNGTPAFFVNGRLIAGAYPFSEFKKIIDEELAGGQNKPTEVRVNVDLGNAPTKGPAGAQIKLVEFSDFQCPFCGQAAPTVKQVLSEYGDKVLLAYKHFPLVQIHPHAQAAAEASECAKDQGKFWEFHDKLFASQQEWSSLQ